MDVQKEKAMKISAAAAEATELSDTGALRLILGSIINSLIS